MEKSLSDIIILYGSQTGTSKYASESLMREFNKHDFKTDIYSLDSYNFENIWNDSFIIFIVSTTGYGDPPTNMKTFWKNLLKKDLDKTLLNLNYSIFGLGDSSYEKFNHIAKLLNSRLRKLGANLFHPMGLGDDQHDFGYEGEFDPWVKSVIEEFKIKFFPEKKNSSLKEIDYLPRYNVQVFENEGDLKKSLEDHEFQNFKTFTEELRFIHGNDYKKGKILSNRTLTDYERIAHNIEIETEEDLNFQCGDISVVYPFNSEANVLKMLNLMKIKSENFLKIVCNQGKSEFPLFIKAKEFLEKWLNINGIPSRFFCYLSSKYAKEELHKEKLELFYEKSVEGKDEYYRYCGKEKITYFEFLHDFNSVELPLDILISQIGPIYPREFSISNSNYTVSNTLELTVGLVESTTLLGRKRQGLCSSWLINRKISEEVIFHIKNGEFPKIPLKENVIIIATGTGIAPIRSFIWDRYWNYKSSEGNEKIGEVVFFYGCRKKDKDFFYCEETELFEEDENFNFRIIPAFSRDQAQKIYVYQKMKENSKKIFEMIFQNNSRILVVGSSKILPKYVDETLIEIIVENKKMDQNEAKNYLNTMKTSKIYYTESW